MQVFPAKTPGIVKSLFPQFVWHIPTNERVLYLTFDDGPTPNITDWVLNCLAAYEAKATFFCIGNNIAKNPDVFERVLHSGHTVGNHTYNHLMGWKTKTKDYINDVILTEELLKKWTDNKFLRPPYGKFKITQAKELLKQGYKVILWDVLSYDWDEGVSPEKCEDNIVSKSESGSIIVMHDSLKAASNLTVVLPKVLEHFSKLGYTFKGLDSTRIRA
jgi:peptidoglycan/xylan/chitin deacetylase (PgdA/CDA1 family)